MEEMFTKSMRRLLESKDYAVFFSVLSNFIEWAEKAETADLQSMLPSENLSVEDFLKHYITTKKISADGKSLFTQ